MTYEQYWFGDPWMARAFAQAYLLKRRVHNEEMWIQGIYFTHALQSVIGTAFGKKQIKYIEKPLDLFEKTKAEKEQEVRAGRQKLINWLNKLKLSTDKGVGKDGKP
jgi:hypothetical protein